MIVLVTDPRFSLDHTLRAVERARAALPPGFLLVQHRDKRSPPEVRDAAARRLVATGAPVVVNGAPEDALRLGARGVHLPGDAPDVAHARALLGPDAWVSVAAHDDDAVERAARAGATAALVSPIFETEGKGPPRGVEALGRARAIAGSRLRVVALGGVDARRAASCVAAGADGIAAIRAILAAPDPAAAALDLARPLLAARP